MKGQQPMPHDSNLMAWDELDEEQKNLFIEGCELFDEGKFWHAHESWEDLWKSLKPLDKPIETDAVQGIIQIAALLYNYERKKIRGVVNMASKLLTRLSGDRYPGLETLVHGERQLAFPWLGGQVLFGMLQIPLQ